MQQNHLDLHPFSSFTTRQFDEDLSVALKWTLNMPANIRRFHSHQVLLYLDSYSLFVVKYAPYYLPPTEDRQENKRHLRIPFSTEKGQILLSKIQIVSILSEDFILVGFANTFSLYRLTTGSFVSSFSVPNGQDKILMISESWQYNNSMSFLTVLTSSQSYLLKISYSNQLNINFIRLENSSILGYLSSYFKKTSEPNQYKCFAFQLEHIVGVFALLFTDGVWKLYRHSITQGTVVKMWEKSLPDFASSEIVNILVESIPNQNIRSLVVYTIAKKQTKSIDLIKLEINFENGDMKLTSRSIAHSNSESVEMVLAAGRLVLVVRDISRKTSTILMYKLNHQQLYLQKQIRTAGCIVAGCDIIITQAEIYNLIADNVSSFPYNFNKYSNTAEQLDNSHSEQSYLREIQRIGQPSTRLEKILRYEETDFELIKQQISVKVNQLENLMRKASQQHCKQAYSRSLTELILHTIQLRVLSDNDSNIKNMIFEQTRPQPISQFFRDTSMVFQLLLNLANSKYWQYLVSLLEHATKIYLQLNTSQLFKVSGQKQVSQKLLPPIVACLNSLRQPQSTLLTQRLLQIGLELSSQDSKLYDYIFQSKKYKQYYQLCASARFHSGIVRLYVQTDYMNAKMIKQYINQNHGQQFLTQLCKYYFQYINGKRIRTLKLLVDLPEYSQLFYQITKHQYPQYSWIIAMNIQIPHNQLQTGLSKVMANNTLNSKMILNLQSNGQFDSVLNTKLEIVKVCERLGWNSMTPEEFVHVVKDKSEEDYEKLKRSIKEIGFSIEILIADSEAIISGQ